MPTTSLSKSNQTQAVWLPKAVAFPDSVKEVEIIVIGNSRLICPKGHRWDNFFDGKSKVTDDFLTERAQGAFKKRRGLED